MAHEADAARTEHQQVGIAGIGLFAYGREQRAAGEMRADADADRFVYVAYFPYFIFWSLDGYFLRQERRYRELYKAVAGKRESEIDFSMDTSSFVNNVDSRFSTCFSKTLGMFYGTIF